MRNIFASSHFNDHNSSQKPINDMHVTNTRGTKGIWLPKVKSLNYEACHLNVCTSIMTNILLPDKDQYQDKDQVKDQDQDENKYQD